MYNRVVTSIRITEGETNVFPITVSLHQGSCLNPCLSTLVIDDITRYIQDKVLRCQLFADIVLNGETRAGINYKLELWREMLES